MATTNATQNASSASSQNNRLSRITTASPSPAPETTSPTPEPRPRRDRRVTSYHHPFQTKCQPSTDPAPSYSVSARLARFPPAPRYLDGGNEILPKYTCTVAKEGPMYMRVEKISPFQCLPKQEWRHVYVVLSGTHLSVHKVKNISLAGHSMPTAGKLIKRYTLQHAEVGLASDAEHSVLLPVSRLAHFIPSAARRKAFERDPELFKPIPQTIMRLRLEIDQILLAHSFEDRIFDWINSLSAGIDIALPLDERAAPKACTIPRRRRRQPQRSSQVIENITDRRVIEEQEQIMRELYPSLAQSVTEEPSGQTDLSRMETTNDSNALSLTLTNDQEDDIDLSMLAEEIVPTQGSRVRPSNSRQTTSSTMSSTNSVNPSPADFNIRGKWAPPHGQSQAQQFRYIRRCMPILLFDSPRASSIIMCHGRRLRINNRMDMLEEWELAPPTYDAHSFPEGLDRSITLASSLATTSSTVSGDSIDSRHGSVGKADSPTIESSKVMTTDADQKRIRHEVPNGRRKTIERTLMEEGIVVVGF